MAEFSLVVEAPIRSYHAYMDQWEAAINTSLFFEREHERSTRVHIGSDRSFMVNIGSQRSFFHGYIFCLYFEQEMPMTFLLLLLKSIVKMNQLQLDTCQEKLAPDGIAQRLMAWRFHAD